MATAALAVAGVAVSGFGVRLHAERAPQAARSAIAPSSLYDVDRARKGDRLKVRGLSARDIGRNGVEPARRGPVVPAYGPKMMLGCDPAFSPLSTSARLNFPSRCLAERAIAHVFG